MEVFNRLGYSPAELQKNREAGAVLVVSMLILFVLAVIGLAAGNASFFESRMSVSLSDQDAAFQAAESGLKAGENYVETLPAKDRGTANCAAPCVATFDSVNGGVYANSSPLPWGSAQTALYEPNGAGNGFPRVASPPEYIVEYVNFIPDSKSSLGAGIGKSLPGSDFYRVTAKGTGRSDDAQAIVQSIYAVRFK